MVAQLFLQFIYDGSRRTADIFPFSIAHQNHYHQFELCVANP
jgi:hypothetical protein